MQTVRHRPLALSRALGTDFDRLFQGWLDDAPRAWAPRLDVLESKDRLVARFEVPGFDAHDLDVTLEDGVLTLTGERSAQTAEDAAEDDVTYHRRELAYGRFRRSVRIGDAFDADDVEATYKDGILEVTVGKRPEVLPRKIEISTAG